MTTALPDYLLILLLTTVSVVVIVHDRRAEFERTLNRRYGINRDWWIPPLALAIAFALSIVGMSELRAAFVDKFDIIVLILSFGIMAEGLGESGFFKYIAYRIVDTCRGNSARLILYMFTMTSITTFFTTNDVVVLVLTPIIVEVCFQARIRNTKPLLLSQFIAANTLSMGLLIGSPTNIILAEELNIDFFTYLGLMFFPALIAFSTSLVIIDWMTRISRSDGSSLFSGLEIQEQYSMPEENPEPFFTTQMRNWILIFGTFVALVAVVTFLQLSLLWCAIPSIFIAFGYWYYSDVHERPIREPMKDLPYGIFFFGMTFFTFAEAFSRSEFMNDNLVPFLQEGLVGEPVRAAFLGVFGSGVVVNIFNDLPAAALVAKVHSDIQLGNYLTEIIFVQASLVGLNIGTYVTPIGALAGLIWFNQIRIHRERHRSTFPELARNMEFPNRSDLIRYGIIHIVVTGTMVALFIIFEWVLISYLIGPWSI